MRQTPARPWTHKEVTRAKKAFEVQMELLLAGVPAGYWFALHVETGEPVSKNGQACWATKPAAVEWLNAHGSDANKWFLECLPFDGIPRSWQSFAATMRVTESVEAYWAANSDPDVRVHFPTQPLVNGGDYA